MILACRRFQQGLNIQAKINQKCTCFANPILDRFLLNFWSIFGRFWPPKSIKNRSKNDAKKYTVWDSLFNRFGIDFWRILGPKTGGLIFSIFLKTALGAILGPRWPPDPSKRPLGSILDRFGTNFGWFLDDFWSDVGWFFNDFGNVFQSIDAFVGTVAEWPLGS